jgi:hypothetical protein
MDFGGKQPTAMIHPGGRYGYVKYFLCVWRATALPHQLQK